MHLYFMFTPISFIYLFVYFIFLCFSPFLVLNFSSHNGINSTLVYSIRQWQARHTTAANHPYPRHPHCHTALPILWHKIWFYISTLNSIRNGSSSSFSLTICFIVCYFLPAILFAQMSMWGCLCMCVCVMSICVNILTFMNAKVKTAVYQNVNFLLTLLWPTKCIRTCNMTLPFHFGSSFECRDGNCFF